jgi:hypothetical protein
VTASDAGARAGGRGGVALYSALLSDLLRVATARVVLGLAVAPAVAGVRLERLPRVGGDWHAGFADAACRRLVGHIGTSRVARR